MLWFNKQQLSNALLPSLATSNVLMFLVLPLSENSGGHNNNHMEVEEVCKILKYFVDVHSISTLLICSTLFTILVTLIVYDTYILPSTINSSGAESTQSFAAQTS